MNYSVYFSGVLLPNYDTKKTILNLYNILKLRKETIRQILTKKNALIATNINEEEALYLIKKLQNCGLILYSIEISDITSNEKFINNDNELKSIIEDFRKNKIINEYLTPKSNELNAQNNQIVKCENSSQNSNQYYSHFFQRFFYKLSIICKSIFKNKVDRNINFSKSTAIKQENLKIFHISTMPVFKYFIVPAIILFLIFYKYDNKNIEQTNTSTTRNLPSNIDNRNNDSEIIRNTTNNTNDAYHPNDDSNIEMVRTGFLKIDESATIGNVLENYNFIKSSHWISFNDKQKRMIVQFEGTIDQLKIAQFLVKSNDLGQLLGIGYAFMRHLDKRQNAVDGAKKIINVMINDKSSILYNNNCKLIIQFTITRDAFKYSYIGLQYNNKPSSLSLDEIVKIYKDKLFDVSAIIDLWSRSI